MLCNNLMILYEFNLSTLCYTVVIQTNTRAPPTETKKTLDHVQSTRDTTTMAVYHKKCHEETTEVYYYHFKYVVIVPGSALTHNGHSASEFKLRSEGTRLTCSSPSFLPGSLSPTSLLLLMSCQGPGLPRTEGVRGGQSPNMGWR